MTTIAWGLMVVAAAVPLYAYAAYPAILWLVGRTRGRGAPAEPAEWPAVTIVLPAYNEAGRLRGAVEALLATDYPADRRHLLVVSDASTDATDDIASEYAGRGVEVLRLPVRSGKTAAENAAQSQLRGEIVVNTDASVRILPDSLRALVAALADPGVGVASGRDVSVGSAGSAANVGESGYVGYEMWVRDLETAAGGIVGASGCFYAVRLPLHMQIVPAALSRDFAAPLIAREHGYRAVSVPDAVCLVPRVPSLRREYRRKVRTMTRGLQTLYYKRHLLNPVRHGRFAWMLWSHKLTRWLVPWCALLGLVAVGLLAATCAWAAALLAASLAVLALAGAGWWWPESRPTPRTLAIPSYAVWGLVAGLHAWLNALRGEMSPIWEPSRREPEAVE